jgi:hypothetical protein
LRDAISASHIFALQIKAETHLRSKMNPADREKLKVALLEPMWQALDMSRTAITAVLPARIDRWGIEYDSRWLPYFRLNLSCLLCMRST